MMDGTHQKKELWEQWQLASSSFCLKIANEIQTSTPQVISSLVDDELDWCGTHALLFIASRYSFLREKLLLKDDTITELDKLRQTSEKSLNEEISRGQVLRQQLRQMSLAAEDTIWELQETNADLKSKLDDAQHRLVEVETFLASDRGAVLLNMEEELAASKLRIAELEAEKDDLEIKANRSKRLQTYSMSNSNSNSIISEKENVRSDGSAKQARESNGRGGFGLVKQRDRSEL